MKIQIFLVFLVLVLFETAKCQWPSSCESNMILNDTCYVVSMSAASFINATAECEKNNGTLAAIKDEETNNKVASIAVETTFYAREISNPNVWIGVTRKRKETAQTLSYFLNPCFIVYSDGSAQNSVVFEPWAIQSGRCTMQKECVSLNTLSRTWYEEFCFQKRRFVCQYERKKCNVQDIVIENAEYDNCYEDKIIPYENEVTVKCQEGFILKGPSKVKCLSSGEWSEVPQCLNGCNSPPSYPNSLLITTKDYYFTDDNATYICNEGYFSDKSPSRSHFTIICSSNGKWSSSEKGCSRHKNYKMAGIEIMNNEFINLPCEVDKPRSNAEPNGESYVWLKDSNELAELAVDYKISTNGDISVYTNSTGNIAGLYMCFLKGERIILGNTIYDVKQPDVFQCEDTSSDTTKQHIYKEGASVLIPCPHNSSYVGFHWFKDNEYFPINDNHVLYPDGSLYIRKVDFSHQGNYTCMMTLKDTFCSRNSTAEVMVLATAESLCGNPSKSKDHPWTLSLWWKDEVAPFCYGSLIHESWVITTAQCLTGLNRKRNLDVFVRFGNVIKGENAKVFIDIPITMVKTHPLFSKKTHLNDIGLVKLERPVRFSNTIQPICFTKTDITAKTSCDRNSSVNGTATGWGSIEKHHMEENSLTEELMTLVETNRCFPSDSHYHDKVLCLKKVEDSEATFASDSGSPLEVLWKDRIYLLGIYSWGDRISHLSEFDYFTKISNYVFWISFTIDEE